MTPKLSKVTKLSHKISCKGDKGKFLLVSKTQKLRENDLTEDHHSEILSLRLFLGINLTKMLVLDTEGGVPKPCPISISGQEMESKANGDKQTS